MNAIQGLSLLAELRAAGLMVEPQGAGRVYVAPRERLTPELRERIKDRKPALLAALEAERLIAVDLARRIRAMGGRWGYSADDFAEAFAAAQRDPAAWLACVAWDEQYATKLQRAGMPFLPSDAN